MTHIISWPYAPYQVFTIFLLTLALVTPGDPERTYCRKRLMKSAEGKMVEAVKIKHIDPKKARCKLVDLR